MEGGGASMEGKEGAMDRRARNQKGEEKKEEEEWLYDTILEIRENLKKRETEIVVL